MACSQDPPVAVFHIYSYCDAKTEAPFDTSSCRPFLSLPAASSKAGPGAGLPKAILMWPGKPHPGRRLALPV